MINATNRLSKNYQMTCTDLIEYWLVMYASYARFRRGEILHAAPYLYHDYPLGTSRMAAGLYCPRGAGANAHCRRTVESHVAHLKEQFGVETSVMLGVMAERWGLVPA